MGTCGSKCCFASPSPSPSPEASIYDPESPHDKAVISSDIPPASTAPPLKDPFLDSPKNHSKFQIHPCPPTSSSSSTTPPTSSSLSTSTITTSNTSTSYYSSYSTANSSSYSTDNSPHFPKHPPLKKKSFSNEFLLSCVENSNIVILDPTRGTKEETVEAQIEKFSEFPITPSEYLSVTSRVVTTPSLRQRTNTNTSIGDNQSNNAKRARSVSPASRAGRKVIKPDQGSWNPVGPNITRPRTRDIQPPQWRPINSQRGFSTSLSGPVSRPVSAIRRDLKGATMDKEAKERQIQDGEVVSRERVKSPPPLVEDLNNPLIAMDCFIFL